MVAKEAPRTRPFRIGGLVEAGSLKRDSDSLTVRFRVTDTAQTIPVTYTGLLPDLFKEGKGVVAQGTLAADGSFHATEVLAKHDENYMPPEAKDALDKARRKSAMALLDLAKANFVSVIGIAYRDKPEDGLAWFAANGDPYKMTIVDDDGRVGVDFGVHGVPEAFVIDTAGSFDICRAAS